MSSPTPPPETPDQGLQDVPPDQGLQDVPTTPTTPSEQRTSTGGPGSKSRTPMVIGIGALAVLVIAILAAVFH